MTNVLDSLVKDYLDRPIFFVTADAHMALGLVGVLPKYHIITGQEQPLLKELEADKVKVFCLERNIEKNLVPKNAGSILAHPDTEEYIKSYSGNEQPVVVFFKPSPKLDRICSERGYLKVGNLSSLCREFEDKVEFFRMYHKFPGMKFTPGLLTQLHLWKSDGILNDPGNKLVVQTGRGWAGRGTYMITSEDDLVALQKFLGQREVKITGFIEGEVLTVNGCVMNERTLLSREAVQINRPHKEWAVNQFTTCGRSWPAPGVSDKVKDGIAELGTQIGSVLRQAGFRGYFGIDVLVSKTDQLFLLEVNPRRTASEAFFTKLEIDAGWVPLAVWDLLAFVAKDERIELVYEGGEIEGTQLMVRNHLAESVEVKQALIPGWYEYQGRKWVLVQTGWNFAVHEGACLSAKAGLVSENSEILRLESKRSLLSIEGELEKELVEGLLALKRDLLKD